MDIKVISVFAGLGKTTVGKRYSNICDLQSSPYRCDYSAINEEDYEKMKYNPLRTQNPEWPNNYLKAIIDAMNNYDIVLVPSNLDIRKLLRDNNIDFLFVLPSNDIDNREKLLEIYKQRGNNDDLIKDVMYNFDNWSRNQEDYNYPIVILDKDKYLEDLLIDMKILKERQKNEKNINCRKK